MKIKNLCIVTTVLQMSLFLRPGKHIYPPFLPAIKMSLRKGESESSFLPSVSIAVLQPLPTFPSF